MSLVYRLALAWTFIGQTVRGSFAPHAGGCSAEAAVHLVAFDSNMRLSNVYLKVSAEANGFTNLVMLGTGMQATWGNGMQHKLNSYRRYVHTHVHECDIVLLVDAGDVLILGSPGEVQKRFLLLEAKWNRSIFFGAEASCTEWEVPICRELEAITGGHSQWRFLNSGLIAGRGHILRSIMQYQVTDAVKHDQEWWRSYSLTYNDTLGLDFDTDLFLVAAAVEGVFSGKWMSTLGQPHGSIMLEEGEDGHPNVVNKFTNSKPLILHFPGPGHWPAWIPGDRSMTIAEWGKGPLDDIGHVLQGHIQSCTIHELFLRLFPRHVSTLKIGKLQQHRLLSFLPRLRPVCTGLDNEAPWQALDNLFKSTRWIAMVSISQMLCMVVLCCQIGSTGKKLQSVMPKMSAKGVLCPKRGAASASKLHNI